ncbi:hypothetical protein E2562_027242 [Oryza meyeriana var. granulata]|uniref:Uncharacterized protein n=1 Tax=Oryza meyeriana var. granulata TaxID=110450 RepID=A0A6G1D8D0_9ORYZ|nr:hypothetical protein E2562_027242 [Oryza meyeriana var. granulata]
MGKRLGLWAVGWRGEAVGLWPGQGGKEAVERDGRRPWATQERAGGVRPWLVHGGKGERK